MRPIHLARLDKTRPVLVLTREAVRPYLNRVTVAPITSAVNGLGSEVPVGVQNGLDRECVVSLDNIATIPAADLGRLLGYLNPAQESALQEAVRYTFALGLPR